MTMVKFCVALGRVALAAVIVPLNVPVVVGVPEVLDIQVLHGEADLLPSVPQPPPSRVELRVAEMRRQGIAVDDRSNKQIAKDASSDKTRSR